MYDTSHGPIPLLIVVTGSSSVTRILGCVSPTNFRSVTKKKIRYTTDRSQGDYYRRLSHCHLSSNRTRGTRLCSLGKVGSLFVSITPTKCNK